MLLNSGLALGDTTGVLVPRGQAFFQAQVTHTSQPGPGALQWLQHGSQWILLAMVLLGGVALTPRTAFLFSWHLSRLDPLEVSFFYLLFQEKI